MAAARDLTKGQKETLKKLLLKQKELEKNKAQIKTAKKQAVKKPTRIKKKAWRKLYTED